MSGATTISWTVRRRRHLGYAAVPPLLTVLVGYAGVLPVFRQHLQHYLGIGEATFGLIFSVGPLVGVGMALLSGPLMDRWGAVRMLRYSLRAAAAGYVVVALAGAHWLVVLAGCTLVTVASGALALACSRYLAQLFPRERRRSLALGLALTSGGSILLPLAAEALLRLPPLWPAVTFGAVLHLPCAALAVALWLMSYWYRSRRPKPRPRVPPPLLDWRSYVFPLPVLWLVGLLALHVAADNALYTWLPRVLDGAALAPPAVAPGVIMSAYSLAYLVSRTGLAALPEGWGRRRMVMLPGLLGGGVLLAGLLTGGFWPVAGGYLLGGLLWSVEYPTIMALVAARSGRRLGAALALAGALGSLLTAVAIHGTGLLAAAVGEAHLAHALLPLAVGFLGVGTAGAVWVRWLSRRSP